MLPGRPHVAAKVNNLNQLGEEANEVLDRVKAQLAAGDRARLKRAAQAYGSERAKKFFACAFAELEAGSAG